jgi:hypothetical protein
MPSDDRQRLARLRLHARRRRAGQLRRRALFLSLSLFALLWVAVFTQMISGHDPVLASGTKVAAVTNKATPDPTSSATDQVGTDQVPSVSGTTSTQPEPAPVTPAPVTTSQS